MTTRQTTHQRAARLPAPVPGQEVTIPLELLPIYFAAHRLEAMDRTEVSKVEERAGTRKEPGAVWVKRTMNDHHLVEKGNASNGE